MWLIHDVSPWRIDNVHVVGADVWVETYFDTSGTDPYAGSPIWHQPARRRPRHEPDCPGRPRDGHIRRSWVDAAQGDVAPGAADSVSEPSTSGVSWPLATGLAAVGVLVGTVLGTLLARPGLRPSHVSRRVEAIGSASPNPASRTRVVLAG